ncbi:hypothetical protein BJY04DRAFT_227725 [Aspergillus karnatakaensis]|uniref:uncharacterized protein n=1 Tax=Aspergillus karnatakaensis TaxID=1810916 RepID=UPI003CCD4080
MTRNRCVDDYKPGQAQVTHYADRARDGTALIKYSPFMITEDHAAAWRTVTDAVHKEGGKIFFQAWHAGRRQHDQMPIIKEMGGRVLAPSSIKADAGKYRDLPGAPGHTGNVVAIEDPREVVETFRHSLQLAKKAGFDGSELLAQGGYLPQQFLNTRANKRTDSYGGSVENRCRFILEIVDVISQVFGGPEFVCVKLNPTDFVNDSVVTFDEMKETYTYLIKELVARKVRIINLSHFFGRTPRPAEHPLPPGYDPVLDFGPLVKFPGSLSLLMANHDYTVEEADRLVRDGKLDLITFGRPFNYNTDVVSRIRHGIPLSDNTRGNAVHYGPYKAPHENYNDWPAAPISDRVIS